MFGWTGKRGAGAEASTPPAPDGRAACGRTPWRTGRAPVPTMRGDAPALEKQFDRGGAEADLDPLVHELVGDAVVVVLDEDVVVDVHAGVAPLGEFVPARRKRAQQRPIELLEQHAARDAELAHRARVERRE